MSIGRLEHLSIEFVSLTRLTYFTSDNAQSFEVSSSDFHSRKLVNKLVQQIHVSSPFCINFSTSFHVLYFPFPSLPLSLPLSPSLITSFSLLSISSPLPPLSPHSLPSPYLLPPSLPLSHKDPLSLASGALPYWTHLLTSTYSFLFPFETRELFFTCTAFGASRLLIQYTMYTNILL